jgi:hypothetical protein
MTVQDEIDLAFAEVGARLKALAAGSGGGSYLNPEFEPGDQNMLGWTVKPEVCSSQVAITAGTAQLTRIKINKSGTINKVYFGLTNVAASLTSSAISIFNTSGVQVATTGDISSQLLATGEKVISLTSGLAVTLGQEYWVVIHAIGTTGPTIRATLTVSGINYGLTTSSPLRTARKTGLTSAAPMPSTVTKTDYQAFANQIPLFMLGT